MALRRLGPNGLKQNAVALVNPLGKYKPIAYNSQAIGYVKLSYLIAPKPVAAGCGLPRF